MDVDVDKTFKIEVEGVTYECRIDSMNLEYPNDLTGLTSIRGSPLGCCRISRTSPPTIEMIIKGVEMKKK